MNEHPLAEPNITITDLSFNEDTQLSSVTFSWYKASDGATDTELIRYDVYDTEGNYFAQAVELGKTIGEFASGTVTVPNITPGIKINISVYVSTNTQNSATEVSAYSPTGGATFSNYTWNDTRTSVTITATAPGAKYLRITAGTTPNGDDLGNTLTVGANGTLTLSDLAHGNGETVYLSAIPESADGHSYGESATYSMFEVKNPILGVYKPKCDDGDTVYIVDIIEKKENAESCTDRWQVGNRVVVVDPCPPSNPPFSNVKCIEESNAPYPNPNPSYDLFSALSSLPTPHYRVYRFTFNPGWNKSKLFNKQTYNNASYPITLEWLNETDVKVTYKPFAQSPAVAFSTFDSITGGVMRFYTQVMESREPGTNKKVYEYKDVVGYQDTANPKANLMFVLTQVESA